MFRYLLHRLMLLPLTLFCILLVNFVVINLAPGEPTTLSEISAEGATRQEENSIAFGSDDRYLQFREFYGLTLPVLYNNWPWATQEEVRHTLWTVVYKKRSPEAKKELDSQEYDAIRLRLGDQARFVMPHLLALSKDPRETEEMRQWAVRFFARGGTRQAVLGPNLTPVQKAYNRKISKDNNFLRRQMEEPLEVSTHNLTHWFRENKAYYRFVPTLKEKVRIFFFETRFFRYMSRVVFLDFGTVRYDRNKTVTSEVVKRFKYSLTLSFLPMFVTFGLCLLFGSLMALNQNRWPDVGGNLFFLTLYAIPVFVVAPFLIEKVALHHFFPFTNIPIPISGFTSADSIYDNMTSYQRLFDICRHIFLPIIAVMYGSLAVQTRLSRTAVLEVMRQDFVRTARAKGVPYRKIITKHVGRNASITIVTALASSLGVVLGGSLIVETLFEINGFGKFFYEAVINRDYNVIMFSAIMGSVLTLCGYLIADIAYTLLDPRVTLD